MIIVMKRGAAKQNVDKVIKKIEELKLKPVPLFGVERTVIAVIGDERYLDIQHLRSFADVSDVMPVLQPYKLASRETKHENTIVKVPTAEIGNGTLVIMAGPCSVESEEQIMTTAEAVKKAGANMLRGGAYKPRTGPYNFEGLGKEGLILLKKAGGKYGLSVVTELMDVRDLDLVSEYTDIIQIGARNMQNFNLLKDLGKAKKPILLKRGLAATIKEFLLAAEYILLNGNQNVILCERGIRTFETETRNTLSLSAVPLIKELSHLPIIVDPSHGTGKRSLVKPMSKAAIACGADGLIIEVHPKPEEALSDGDQSLLPEQFSELMVELKKITEAVDKKLP
jgi:3-deoxy-7-phosphoheptulonate synthase